MNIINVYTHGQKSIVVNGEPLTFDFVVPSIFPTNFFSLTWWEHENRYEFRTIEGNDPFNQTIHTLNGTEDDYNTYVKPFIQQFEEYTPNEAEIRKLLTDAAQHYMDDTVSKRGYDGILSACSYSNSTDETFRAEGQACLVWRDEVWRACYAILEAVLAGNRAIPTEEEMIAELPVLEW